MLKLTKYEMELLQYAAMHLNNNSPRAIPQFKTALASAINKLADELERIISDDEHEYTIDHPFVD